MRLSWLGRVSNRLVTSDQIGTHGGDVPHRRTTVTVADEVHLGLSADRHDLFDLLQQFFAPKLGCIELADFGQ